jgi:hypothetical protein
LISPLTAQFGAGLNWAKRHLRRISVVDPERTNGLLDNRHKNELAGSSLSTIYVAFEGSSWTGCMSDMCHWLVAFLVLRLLCNQGESKCRHGETSCKVALHEWPQNHFGNNHSLKIQSASQDVGWCRDYLTAVKKYSPKTNHSKFL